MDHNRPGSNHEQSAPTEHSSTRVKDELRCVCGALMARYVPGGVELKCRRCKRVVFVPVTDCE